MGLAADVPSFGRRAAAFALDYLLIVAYLAALGVVGSVLTFGPARDQWQQLVSTPGRMDLVAFSTAVLPVILYFTLLEGSARGATWGKWRMRLRVVRVGGGRLGRRRAFVRAGLKFVPWQLAHTCLVHIPGWPAEPQEPPLWVLLGMVLVWLLIGLYIVTAVVPGRRTPYDWVAGSQVVGREANAAD
jgi:uncharacterized RDD family membrane protein YckC